MKNLALTFMVCLLLLSSCSNQAKPKNIILMIGDGMGTQQVAQAIQYQKLYLKDGHPLNLEILQKQHHQGLVETHSANGIVTDSAAAATAMACGFKTNGEMIGQDKEGQKCHSIVDIAKSNGLATGLISNTRLSHATPGAFVSQNIWRNNENEIAEQIIAEAKVDILLNGGGRHLIPQFNVDGKTPMTWSEVPECKGIDKIIDGKSKRIDQMDLIKLARDKGYEFVCTAEQLQALANKSINKLVGVFAASSFPYIQERESSPTVPSLATLTTTALNILSKNQNGFFLMVEGGQIDYAAHDNDVGTMLKETLDFDKTIGVVLEFIKTHPDTLLIVTADHETGGFGFSYRWLTNDESKLPEHTRIPEKSRPDYRYPAPEMIFKKLSEQNIAFRSVIHPFLASIYANDDVVTPISPEAYANGVTAFVELIKDKLDYTITESDANYVLSRENRRSQVHLTVEHTPFCGHYWIDAHLNKFAEVIGVENHSVWASGNHTASPVHVFAVGPEHHASKVSGLIDNTDIFKIMKSALE